MPPHLHPRSRFTSSLFAGTLFASFFVVALPHVLPCPAPRVVYADDGSGSQRPRRRRRKCPVDEAGEQGKEQGQLQMQLKTVGELERERVNIRISMRRFGRKWVVAVVNQMMERKWKGAGILLSASVRCRNLEVF
ncbi:hypothetical protein H4I96_07682 [Botrytis cinerea]